MKLIDSWNTFLDTAIQRFLRVGSMSDADWAAWQSARTLTDIGQLTSKWLNDEIQSYPSAVPSCGPAPDIAELIPVLTRLNQSGFVTYASQPGFDGGDHRRRHWRQRAAVSGFVDDDGVYNRLVNALRGSGMMVLVRRSSDRRDDDEPAAMCDGRVVSWFGTVWKEKDLRSGWAGYGMCHPEAVDAIVAARQVTIIDTVWGLNDGLWPLLEKAV